MCNFSDCTTKYIIQTDYSQCYVAAAGRGRALNYWLPGFSPRDVTANVTRLRPWIVGLRHRHRRPLVAIYWASVAMATRIMYRLTAVKIFKFCNIIKIMCVIQIIIIVFSNISLSFVVSIKVFSDTSNTRKYVFERLVTRKLIQFNIRKIVVVQ